MKFFFLSMLCKISVIIVPKTSVWSKKQSIQALEIASIMKEIHLCLTLYKTGPLTSSFPSMCACWNKEYRVQPNISRHVYYLSGRKLIWLRKINTPMSGTLLNKTKQPLTRWMIPALWMYCGKKETEQVTYRHNWIYNKIIISGILCHMTVCMTTLCSISKPDKISTQYVGSGMSASEGQQMLEVLIYASLQQDSWAYPETTERLVDKKLDFVFWKGASHLRQISEHVRHH